MQIYHLAPMNGSHCRGVAASASPTVALFLRPGGVSGSRKPPPVDSILRYLALLFSFTACLICENPTAKTSQMFAWQGFPSADWRERICRGEGGGGTAAHPLIDRAAAPRVTFVKT